MKGVFNVISLNTKKMAQVISVLRQIDPDMPLSVIVVLMAMADNEPQEARELQRKLGLSTSALGRALTTLGSEHWNRSSNKGGYNLVQQHVSPEDRRVRIATLTPKGRALMSTIEELLT